MGPCPGSSVQLALEDGTPLRPGQDRDTTTITYGTGKLTGEYIQDMLCLRQGSGPAAESRFPFTELPFDGIFGLGLGGLSAGPSFNFVNRLVAANEVIRSPTFAFFLRRLDADEDSEITFGGYRPERLEGDVTWLPVPKDEADEKGYWLVTMRDIYVRDKPLHVCDDFRSKPRCQVAMDTGTALMMGPRHGVAELLRQIGGHDVFALLLSDFAGASVPVRQWAAVDGFDLQDQVPEIVDSGVVEPAALPRVLVKDEWRKKWRETKRWRHVRRGWLKELDLTRGSLGQALSQLQVWADIEREAKDASDAYLVVEDDCKFWSEVTSESLQDHVAKVPKNWDLICFSGEDMLGAPETDPWQGWIGGYCVSPPLASRPKRSGKAKGEEELTDSLDAVVAWSMRLTDKPLPKGSISHIWHPDREIEGHSNMVPEAIEVMNERLDMTWGDSLATVPSFHREHPDVKCELIFIDGGHSYDVAIRDLKNFAALANLKNNVLLLDDTFLDDVRRAWDEMLDMGYVEEFRSYNGEIPVGSYGFTLGRYTELASELLTETTET
eukprot:s218_g33.t1